MWALPILLSVSLWIWAAMWVMPVIDACNRLSHPSGFVCRVQAWTFNLCREVSLGTPAVPGAGPPVLPARLRDDILLGRIVTGAGVIAQP